MKKFILKFILLVAVVQIVVGLYARFGELNFFRYEYPVIAFQHRFVTRRSAVDPSVLFVGDSRLMAGVIPESFGPGDYLLSMPACTPLEEYYYLAEYLRHHRPPATVFLSIAPIHLERARYFWTMVRYGLLDDRDVRDVLTKTDTLHLDWIHGTGHFEAGPFVNFVGRYLGRYDLRPLYALARIKFFPFYLDDLRQAGIVTRRPENLQVARRIAAHRGYFELKPFFAPVMENDESLAGPFQPSRTSDYYLHAILALCKARGIHVIFETAPFTRASTEATYFAFFRRYRTYVAGLAKEYPGFTSDGGIGWYPDNLFADPSHLNRGGAERYSRYLRDKYPELATSSVR